MGRHGGSYERTRKHRKRRGRNRQSWIDKGRGSGPSFTKTSRGKN